MVSWQNRFTLTRIVISFKVAIKSGSNFFCVLLYIKELFVYGIC